MSEIKMTLEEFQQRERSMSQLAAENEDMRSALQIIYTWSRVDGETLDNKRVMELAAKTLRMEGK